MNQDETTLVPGREHLNFIEQARKAFAFLTDLGFREVEALPTLVRFQNRDLQVNVYHGRRSYEIGFEISQGGGKEFGLADILFAARAEDAARFRLPMASTAEGVVAGLTRLGVLTERYARPALLGDPSFFSVMAALQQKHWEDYLAGMVADRVRPKAEEAWRKKDYAKAAELYREILVSLSPAELQKLAYAEKRRR